MSSSFLQARIDSPALEPGRVWVAELRGREAISRPFEIELRLATNGGAIDEEKLLTSPASVVFERKDHETGEVTEVRRISGIVRSLLDRTSSEGDRREFIATLVPRAWQATLSRTSDVCMDVSVPDLLQKKLLEATGLEPGTDVELRLSASYAPREFIVQYKETTLDFVSRLAEDLGIHFFFEQGEDREIMVFADSNAAFGPALPETTRFRGRGEHTEVFELEGRRTLVPKSFVARDYNYRNPAMDVVGNATSSALGSGTVDEYGPHAKTPEEATMYASIRAEEAIARSFTFEGRSDLPGLRAGSVLKVEDHPRGELELVITEVVHEFVQVVFGQAAAKDRTYSNRFRAVPKSVVYRPARTTPKPVVHGVVTGHVETESATDYGAVDDQGRYKVAFMYDSVTGRGDGKASRPLRMAQPSAGADRGFHQPLKSGTEVIITCINGDPDRPLITGAVPNPQTPSPVSSGNAEKSMWKTNVNAIAIDDDKPRCKITVSGEDHVLQMGEPNAPEYGFFLGSAGHASTIVKGGSTAISDVTTAIQKRKTSLTGGDIVNLAGSETPWNHGQTAEAIVSGAVGLAKTLVGMCAAGQQVFIDYYKAEQKACNEAHEALEKQIAEDLELDTSPKEKTNADGTTRQETADEALDRAVAEALKDGKHPEEEAALQASGDEAAAAAASVKSSEASLATVASGPIAMVLTSAALAADALKGLNFLYSKVSAFLSTVVQVTTFEAAKALQQSAQDAAAKVTAERNPAKLGAFDKPFNLQGGKHTASLQGATNAFVHGGDHATVFSKGNATLLSLGAAHVKAGKLVEIASGELLALTAKQKLDVHSSGEIQIVAKSGINVTTEEKNLAVAVAGGAASITAKGDLTLKTQATNFTVAADEGNGTVKASKELTLECAAGKWRTKTLTLDTDSGTWEAKREITVRSNKFSVGGESGEWSTSGDITLTAKNLTVNGKVLLG